MNQAASNEVVIRKFYTAFASKDASTMASCYHQEVVFEDPAFGKLNGVEASKMWEMLLTRSKDLAVVFSNVQTTEKQGAADWVATYTFSRTGNKVINSIHAIFEFKDGKIIKHTDSFNLSKWFVSAFGWKGLLFAYIPFLKNKFKQQAKKTLTDYIAKNQ
ncbi:nuclear transport factor 2 family protein [Chryseotalea sanaruensis]|uniref:Nuclear transport factor 2 family protein n=1 Tax=Chryseotalea sanaruensis TaxID=2482724 RepID=A0A401U872_9BACT|nr:nuclear transport factor 2 family protein [Chryseotalea sanaruensis]GCC51093.1 nuclear transport factor 2 family protein [Chryseotalea sanaruensis]